MLLPLPRRLSIGTQVLAAVLVAVTVVSGVLLLFFAQRQRTQAGQALEARVVGTADMLSVGVALGLRSTDLTGLARAMSYARRDPAIRWVIVEDADRNTIASYAPPGDLVPPPARNVPVGIPVRRGSELTIIMPIRDGDDELGLLHLGVSLSAAEAAIRQDLRTALVVVIAIALLAGVFGVVVSRRISQPIEELRDAVVSFTEGSEAIMPEAGSGETAELGRAFRSMAERIHESMAVLTTQAGELASSRDAALGATKTKSLFLATMSHELRTPMTGVLGMLDLLSRTSLSAKQQTFARTARDSAESLLVLIDDILDFSKIEAGKLDLEEVVFDPRSVAEDVAALLAERAHRKGLMLLCDVAHDVPAAVTGDPTRLRQILLNLGGNAVKFTASGEVRIVVRVLEDRDERVVVRFSVHDTGPGISRSAQAQLFRAFSQADASTTRHFGGTGLGLSICKGLAELMGGRIAVSSVERRGTEFRVDVPFVVASPSPAETEQPLAGRRVLLIHPTDSQGRVIRGYLQHAGATVLDAEHLEAWVRSTDQGPLDAVVLCTGKSASPPEEQLSRLCASGGISTSKVVLLVTLDSTVLLENELGGVCTLPLPVRRQALISEVQAAGSATSVPAPLVEHEPELARSGCTVLVAEDHPVNRMIARLMLTELGHNVILAENGEEALTRLQEHSVDLVLMDCQMPVCDGFEATRELRRREAGGPRTPVVALTANAVKGDREACLAAGMDDYLSKPYTRRQLSEICEQWLLRPAVVDVDLFPRPRASSAPERLIDRLQEHLGETDPTFARELLEKFVALSVDSVATMRCAVAEGDWGTLRRLAHQLRGASGSVCADGIATAARELEFLPVEASPAAAGALLREIEAQLDDLREVRHAG